MENGIQNGTRSNHDREPAMNSVGGEQRALDGKSDKMASVSAQATGSPVNGIVGHVPKSDGPPSAPYGARTNPNRMNDLPDEVNHITQGFIPLSTILVRLAQATHDDLQKAIVDSANIKWMPAAINGGTPNGADLPDDNSEGNRKRKTTLLRFAQDAHAKWVKALVITDWSRKADAVSKLIDLKAHLDGKRMMFDFTQNDLIGLKRDLTQARLPRPDLKTALQILSTGEAPWIPEPGYITPPPLTAEEQIKWVEELNTLLSLRLNLDDYSKIPHQFKDFSIESGRVTFRVKGEFEVDLTIADEDFEKQFWFIDFRFAFSPSTARVDNRLMNVLEARVNELLGTDGLASCYNFLHEFVLTHKINELKRQANELARTSWTGNLKVEPLNRALAIQYWTGRYGPNAPKSWVMVAVQSGKPAGGSQDVKHPSRLVAKWYRDNKEIKDVSLDFNVEDLSAEGLLKSAISRHVEHILSSVHEKLAAAPRFVRKETFMRLNISKDEPLDSFLQMQLGPKLNVTLVIEPVTGFAAVEPHTKYALQGESRLNHGGKDPAEDGVYCLENIRWGYVIDEFNRRGKSTGWNMTKNPVSGEEIKRVIKTREHYHPVFFQRQGLGQDWFVMMTLSLSGDEWWLIQVKQTENTRSIAAHLNLQLTKGQPDLSDTFWDNLTLFAAGIISHYGEIGQLHNIGIRYKTRIATGHPMPLEVKIPSLLLGLSDILSLPAPEADEPVGAQPQPSWAEDKVEIIYSGLRHSPSGDAESGGRTPLGTTVMALVQVTDRDKFKQLPAQVDKDVSFNKRTGQFRFLMRGSVGQPIMEQLAEHIRSVDRLVALLEAIRSARGSMKVVEVNLRRARFTYPDVQPTGSSEEPRQWTAILDMSASKARLVLEQGNPHLRLLNYLNKLANTQGGLSILMAYLVEILPLLKAADYIDEKWAGLGDESSAHVTIIPRSADWFVYRYELQDANGQQRRLCLDLRSRNREETGYWMLRREGAAPDREEDDLDKVLRKVFDNSGDLWRGFSGSAAAVQGSVGVLNMLIATDEAVRTHSQGGDLAAVEAALKALPSPVRISEVASFPMAQPPPPQQQDRRPSQSQGPQDRRPSQTQGQQDRRPSQSVGQSIQDRRQSMGQGQQMRLSQAARPAQGQRQNSSNKASGTKDTPFVLD